MTVSGAGGAGPVYRRGPEEPLDREIKRNITELVDLAQTEEPGEAFDKTFWHLAQRIEQYIAENPKLSQEDIDTLRAIPGKLVSLKELHAQGEPTEALVANINKDRAQVFKLRSFM